jgi:putative membrane protein
MYALTTLAVTQVAAHQWAHPWGWWAPFGFLLWVGAVAVAAFFVVRVLPARHVPVQRSSARDILAERFARGEMTSDEYEERLSHLV